MSLIQTIRSSSLKAIQRRSRSRNTRNYVLCPLLGFQARGNEISPYRDGIQSVRMRKDEEMSVRPTLLTPYDVPREVYPYRRVWRTALIEIGLLVALTAVVMLAMRVTHATLGDTTRHVIGLILALVPLGLWLAISYRGERHVPQPRARLLLVVLLSALLANAIGVPVVDRLFSVDQWLPTASAVTRMIGYTLIAGFTMEFLKFAVLRYSVWEEHIKTRQDGIAYSLAAAVG